jgi:hypothetical protein
MTNHKKIIRAKPAIIKIIPIRNRTTPNFCQIKTSSVITSIVSSGSFVTLMLLQTLKTQAYRQNTDFSFYVRVKGLCESAFKYMREIDVIVDNVVKTYKVNLSSYVCDMDILG